MTQLYIVVGLLLAVATSVCQAQFTRTNYWLDSCPDATTDAGWPVCASTEFAKIFSSDGPCKGVITRVNDDLFSSCYCKAQVQEGGCYKTICPTAALDLYTSSISETECASVDWAKITNEATPVGPVTGAGGNGGGSRPTPTGGSGQPGTTRNAGSGGFVAPIAGGLLAWLIGVAAVLL